MGCGSSKTDAAADADDDRKHHRHHHRHHQDRNNEDSDGEDHHRSTSSRERGHSKHNKPQHLLAVGAEHAPTPKPHDDSSSPHAHAAAGNGHHARSGQGLSSSHRKSSSTDHGDPHHHRRSHTRHPRDDDKTGGAEEEAAEDSCELLPGLVTSVESGAGAGAGAGAGGGDTDVSTPQQQHGKGVSGSRVSIGAQGQQQLSSPIGTPSSYLLSPQPSSSQRHTGRNQRQQRGVSGFNGAMNPLVAGSPPGGRAGPTATSLATLSSGEGGDTSRQRDHGDSGTADEERGGGVRRLSPNDSDDPHHQRKPAHPSHRQPPHVPDHLVDDIGGSGRGRQRKAGGDHSFSLSSNDEVKASRRGVKVSSSHRLEQPISRNSSGSKQQVGGGGGGGGLVTFDARNDAATSSVGGSNAHNALFGAMVGGDAPMDLPDVSVTPTAGGLAMTPSGTAMHIGGNAGTSIFQMSRSTSALQSRQSHRSMNDASASNMSTANASLLLSVRCDALSQELHTFRKAPGHYSTFLHVTPRRYIALRLLRGNCYIGINTFNVYKDLNPDTVEEAVAYVPTAEERHQRIRAELGDLSLLTGSAVLFNAQGRIVPLSFVRSDPTKIEKIARSRPVAVCEYLQDVSQTLHHSLDQLLDSSELSGKELGHSLLVVASMRELSSNIHHSRLSCVLFHLECLLRDLLYLTDRRISFRAMTELPLVASVFLGLTERDPTNEDTDFVSGFFGERIDERSAFLVSFRGSVNPHRYSTSLRSSRSKSGTSMKKAGSHVENDDDGGGNDDDKKHDEGPSNDNKNVVEKHTPHAAAYSASPSDSPHSSQSESSSDEEHEERKGDYGEVELVPCAQFLDLEDSYFEDRVRYTMRLRKGLVEGVRAEARYCIAVATRIVEEVKVCDKLEAQHTIGSFWSP